MCTLIPAQALVVPRPVWALSLGPMNKAHAIPTDASIWVHEHRNRPVALGWCRFPGLVDDESLERAALSDVYHCHACTRALVAADVCPMCLGVGTITRRTVLGPGRTNYTVKPCIHCSGTGKPSVH